MKHMARYTTLDIHLTDKPLRMRLRLAWMILTGQAFRLPLAPHIPRLNGAPLKEIQC